MLIIMVPILFNKDLFEPSYNDLKFIVQNTFLQVRSKFVYSCSVKIHASGFDELLESFFSAKSC